MKFDVIIGNPPYQLSTGGAGRQATPLYNLFIEQAIKINPKYLLMITPSRWFGGGMGLGSFRDTMLKSKKISKLVDYTKSRYVFENVDISGGIAYFLWEKDYEGDCEVTTVHAGKSECNIRNLSEFSTFIRQKTARDIVLKVQNSKKTSITSIVSGMKPFGLSTKDRPTKHGDLQLISSGGIGPFDRRNLVKGHEHLDKWIVITSAASHDHGGQADKEGKRRVLSRLEVHPPNTVCTESYILMGTFETSKTAMNYYEYLSTNFVRFLVSQLAFSQHITRERFNFVPFVNLTETWTDQKLNAKYGLTEREVEFIEKMIKPMTQAARSKSPDYSLMPH